MLRFEVLIDHNSQAIVKIVNEEPGPVGTQEPSSCMDQGSLIIPCGPSRA